MTRLDVKRLAVLDMWGTAGTSRRRRLIRAEFLVGVIGCTGLGVYVLATGSGWMTALWDRSIVSVTEIRGPLASGARYRETHRVFLRAHAIELEVTEYEPTRRIAYRTVSGAPPSTSRYELMPGHGAMTVRASAEADIGGLLVLLAPLLRRAMQRQLPKTLKDLKSYCDAA